MNLTEQEFKELQKRSHRINGGAENRLKSAVESVLMTNSEHQKLHAIQREEGEESENYSSRDTSKP